MLVVVVRMAGRSSYGRARHNLACRTFTQALVMMTSSSVVTGCEAMLLLLLVLLLKALLLLLQDRWMTLLLCRGRRGALPAEDATVEGATPATAAYARLSSRSRRNGQVAAETVGRPASATRRR